MYVYLFASDAKLFLEVPLAIQELSYKSLPAWNQSILEKNICTIKKYVFRGVKSKVFEVLSNKESLCIHLSVWKLTEK